MKTRIATFASLMAVCLLSFLSAYAADVKGMIKARAGDTLVVSTGSGDVTVQLTETTRTKDNTGMFGWSRTEMSQAVLIPGLKVDIDVAGDGTPDQNGRVVAKTITVDGDDVETSQLIAAGLHPTAEKVAENERGIASNKQDIAGNRQNISLNRKDIDAHTQNLLAHKDQIDQNAKDIDAAESRFLQLDDYDVKNQATVKFASGSAKLSKKAEDALKELGQNAAGINGYFVEVTGFADATGNAVMNTKLSEDRAKTVVTYLFQQCGIPMRRIVAPGAMGEYAPTAGNETKAGRAENRRVEVKVLVNKGISGT